MAKKEPEEEIIADIKYQSFVDIFGVNYKKGVFVFEFGQGVDRPLKFTTRLFIDANATKQFFTLFREQIEEYEKKYGKI